MPHRFILIVLFAALPGLALAAGARYQLDPVHTRVLFAIEHAGFSSALGTISGSEGVLYFDPANWEDARLDVSIPMSRLDLGDGKWNDAALARNLLDGKRYPDARFLSTHVQPIDDRHARVTGLLTLRGVTGEIVLDVTLNALKRHPMPPFRRTAGFSATATLSRRAFGISAWPSMIGDEVQLRIEAEAVRARGGEDAQDPADEPPHEPTEETDIHPGSTP